MKIGLKLTLTFIIVAFLSMLTVGIISYHRAKSALKEESFNRLTAVREMKAGQITNYFLQISDQLINFSEDPSIIESMRLFKEGFNSSFDEARLTTNQLQQKQEDLLRYLDTVTIRRLNKNLEIPFQAKDIFSDNKNANVLQHGFMVKNPFPVDEKLKANSMPLECSYNITHKKYHPVLRNICERFGYYDVFLIDNESGNIVYTVYKEADFATSLIDGPFSATNLGRSFREAKNSEQKSKAVLVDFAAYLPSYNAPASFMAAPIYDGDKLIGVLAFQMPIDKIDDIMTSYKKWSDVGLGKTGETYLVGEDFTIRNQSRFLLEDSLNYFKLLNEKGVDKKIIDRIRTVGKTVGLQPVKTFGTEEALKGQAGTKIFNDYRGVPVLSAFKPLNVLGLNWAIMSEIDEEEAFSHIYELRKYIIIAFAGLLVLLILFSIMISKRITAPLKELTYDAQELAKGNFDVQILISGKDEIGILAAGFRNMQSSISQLIHGLEDKVQERTVEVMKQKHIVEEKQKEIVDSITYAKRIQYTLLANERFMAKYLGESFVIFQPKDIVSGDFYWATKTNTHFYLAVCDSTGHGVPGAFMSLLNISFLNEAINEKNITEPHLILNHVRERLIKNISREGGQDGMDGTLLAIELKTRKMTFSGAHNAPVIIRNKELIEYKADKMPIGKGVRDESFISQELDIQKGDMLYLFTDGFPDQFGGPKGKKFKYKNLHKTFIDIASESAPIQKEKMELLFKNWMGDLEQLDDVCVIGFRI